jgi:hypothetical protein
MTLRADHVAGAAFIAFGVLVIALSGDLPIGAGFLPKILAGFTIAFGIVLIVRGGESRPFAEIEWSDAKHAVAVTAITAVAVYLFEILGFLTTMVAMMFVLLIAIERRPLLNAVLYSLGVVGVTYLTFVYVLKTPLVTGPFGF